MAQAKQPIQLPPLPQPIGQFSATIARGTETIVLKEKVLSLSGDSFDIKTISGQPLFKVQGRHATISGRKSVYDMAGNHLFDLCKEHFHLHATYVAETPDKHKFLEIKSSIKREEPLPLERFFGSKATATFTAPDGQTHVFAMRGDWLDSQAEIVLGADKQGPVVGLIDRKFFNKREFFGGQQTYAVTIAPGMDMALAVALCIALDEKNNEK
ncbi:Protein LURP-one-related 10 [Beauveria bassiana]|uniref:Protein LURP-one-related 10 n=1 Tax=Beauveria bassiana TaxID=176275 RepID=A0A2N6NJ50_BEABA|nr:Protein LURP-one-related 10 [Beauveria bassiana]